MPPPASRRSGLILRLAFHEEEVLNFALPKSRELSACGVIQTSEMSRWRDFRGAPISARAVCCVLAKSRARGLRCVQIATGGKL